MRLRDRHPNKVSDNVAVADGFMSDEVELVSAFADDDRAQTIVSALAAVAHPDFALIDRDSLENAGCPIPLQGYVAAWRHFLESWERLHLVVEDMVEHRNHVVVIARVSGESKVAGIRRRTAAPPCGRSSAAACCASSSSRAPPRRSMPPACRPRRIPRRSRSCRRCGSRWPRTSALRGGVKFFSLPHRSPVWQRKT